jgi:hypothetical protein
MADQAEKQAEELEPDELERQEGEPLPEREVMSRIDVPFPQPAADIDGVDGLTPIDTVPKA